MEIATSTDILSEVLANQSDMLSLLEGVSGMLTLIACLIMMIIFFAITNWFFKFVNGLIS